MKKKTLLLTALLTLFSIVGVARTPINLRPIVPFPGPTPRTEPMETVFAFQDSDEISILCEDVSCTLVVTIYDATGMVVFSNSYNTIEEVIIDTTMFTVGSYNLVLSYNATTYIGQFEL